MDNSLESLKDIDIRYFLQEMGFEIIQSRKMKCPFHDDDKPSMVIYPPPQNEFHCFGCGKHGDIVNFYAAIHQLSFKKALDELAEKYLFHRSSQETRKINVNQVYSKIVKEATPQKSTVIATNIYESLRQFCLNQVPTDSARRAANYLRGRGIDDWTIRYFKIFVIKNYSETNDYLKNNFKMQELVDSGLFNQKGNLIFFVHPIIIPYFSDGKIVYLQGRTIGTPPENNHKYQFLSGVPRIIFNADVLKNLRNNTEIYITEGAFDCMILVKNGMSAISLGSAALFKPEWIKILKKFKVFICFDNDEAGQENALKLMEKLIFHGILAEIKDLTKGFKDINEYFERKKLE